MEKEGEVAMTYFVEKKENTPREKATHTKLYSNTIKCMQGHKCTKRCANKQSGAVSQTQLSHLGSGSQNPIYCRWQLSIFAVEGRGSDGLATAVGSIPFSTAAWIWGSCVIPDRLTHLLHQSITTTYSPFTCITPVKTIWNTAMCA